MSDDLKSKLQNAGFMALIALVTSFAGVEKSDHDSAKASGGTSWIGTDFQQHTDRENELQRQIDDLRQQLNERHIHELNQHP